RERVRMHGLRLVSSGALDTASEAVFEALPDGRTACTGTLFVRADELDAVVRALHDSGLEVTEAQDRAADGPPRMCRVPWFAAGDGVQLAHAVYAALGHTNN